MLTVKLTGASLWTSTLTGRQKTVFTSKCAAKIKLFKFCLRHLWLKPKQTKSTSPSPRVAEIYRKSQGNQMPNSRTHWQTLKLHLNIYLNIPLLSDLLDDKSCWKPDPTGIGLYSCQVEPRNTKVNKSMLWKRAWCPWVIIPLQSCSAESGLEHSVLQWIHPLRALNMK